MFRIYRDKAMRCVVFETGIDGYTAHTAKIATPQGWQNLMSSPTMGLDRDPVHYRLVKKERELTLYINGVQTAHTANLPPYE